MRIATRLIPRSATLGACAFLAASGPVLAHHSAAMFDAAKTMTLSGTVRDFQWTNPHCWIQLLVTDNGAVKEWSIEMGAPYELMRGGWKPGFLKPGDKISVVVNPVRDGSLGAQFVSATGVDGKPLGQPR